MARKSNNHFGIKCGSGWNGKRAYHTDDAPNECFRAYKHPKDSYEDHSKFLRTKTRYAFLFELKVTDYKGWARGLKKAGYATDPRYANRLIDIIELYDLYEYDQKGKKDWMKGVTNPHQPYLANDLLYIIAREGDTFKSIAKEFDLSKKRYVPSTSCPKTTSSPVVKWFTWKKSTNMPRTDSSAARFIREIPCIPLPNDMV